MFYVRTQSVPRSKHSIPVVKTSQLMLYREIIAVCSEINTKPINTLCGQNVELLDVKDVLVKLSVGLLWLKLHSTRRGLFLLAHWTWN
jgi:hypothetical protein